MGRIISIAAGAEELFWQEEAANIHSVYKNTINIRFHNGIYAIQPYDIWFTPMTIQVDRMPGGVVREGDFVFVNQSGMVIGRERYGREAAETRSCKIKTVMQSQTEMSCLRNLIRERLLRTSEGIAPGIMLDGAGGEVSRKAHEICEKAKEFLVNGHIKEAAGELTSMIGLGPGLTPSGDDFLTGLMAVLWMTGEREFLSQIRRETERNLERTNEISAAYLSHACRGEFSEPFHYLVSMENMMAAVHKIASVGHSSGTDALTGIYFGLEQFG